MRILSACAWKRDRVNALKNELNYINSKINNLQDDDITKILLAIRK